MLPLNYQNLQHAQDMLFLLNSYALKAIEGANALSHYIENMATQKSYCKTILEILKGHQILRKVYLKSDFLSFELNSKMSKALSWENFFNYA